MYITNETMECTSKGFTIYYEEEAGYIRGVKSPEGETSEDVDYVDGTDCEVEYSVKFSNYSIIIIAGLDSDGYITDVCVL